MSGNFAQLRQQITSGDVLLPGDEGYKESLKRWSEGAEKPAVRSDLCSDPFELLLLSSMPRGAE